MSKRTSKKKEAGPATYLPWRTCGAAVLTDISGADYSRPVTIRRVCDCRNPNYISEADSRANARFIALACNCHADLLEAAKLVLAGLDARMEQAPANSVPVFYGAAELRDAVSKAEAQS